MKTLYLECKMGVSGDMLMGSLLELLSEKEKRIFFHKINDLELDGVYVHSHQEKRCGILGTKVSVTIDGKEESCEEHFHHHADGNQHHPHQGLEDVKAIIEKLSVSDKVKKDALEIYMEIARAEAKIHGTEISQVHFHEVGSLDAVADVVGSCILLELIGADHIIASPICVGTGTVDCAHGILPVPAPATALLLREVPIYGGKIESELCTPTGAAILTHFASEFGELPPMSIEKIGYGLGTKEFEMANVVRSMIGESFGRTNFFPEENLIELCANIDDMTGEDLSFAMEIFMDAGARDVYVQPIVMKKGRPSYKLVVAVKAEDEKRMVSLIFKHTSTIGIRKYKCQRYVLDREISEEETPFGIVRVKTSKGFGTEKEKFELEDLKKIAKRRNLSLQEVRKSIKKKE